MHRRPLLVGLSTLLLAAPLTAPAQTPPTIGVLMLHGKSPGSAQDPNFGVLKTRLEREGMMVLIPDMPWSRSRYLDGHWDQAMAEIATHVRTLRERGARQIVLAGHSMGCPAALGFAARGGDVQALVLLAPGHVPKGYYTVPRLQPVRDSIDEARALVAAGKGDSKESFNDINQGRQQPVITTARNFLSYFDPASDAEMSVTAPRVPATTPTMVVLGDKDPLFKGARSYFADQLPANPKSLYLEVEADHLSTPRVAGDAVADWIRKALAG
jgi:pimeloyl-ACP methyl ester carboxylesterase